MKFNSLLPVALILVTFATITPEIKINADSYSAVNPANPVTIA